MGKKTKKTIKTMKQAIREIKESLQLNINLLDKLLELEDKG